MSQIVLEKFEHTRGGATGRKYYDFIVWIDGEKRAVWQHEYHGRGYFLSVRHGSYFASLKAKSSDERGTRQFSIKADSKAQLEAETRKVLEAGYIPTLVQLAELEQEQIRNKRRQEEHQKKQAREGRIEAKSHEMYAIIMRLKAEAPTEEIESIIDYVEQN